MRQPFYHSDEPAGGSPAPVAPSPVQPQAEPLFEIGGGKFTEVQLKEALGGLDRVEEAKREAQADYTRKTQDIARKRKEVEEMETRAQRLLERAEREVLSDTPVDVFEQAVRPLKEQVSQLTEAFAEERRVRQEREGKIEASNNLSTALQSLKGRPFINDQTTSELRSFMERNGLGPEHVALAYSAHFGSQIGELKGRQYAISEGAASGPPLMGSGNTRISPGFTAPNEAPGTEVPIESMSWEDVKAAAMRATDKPNF